MRGFSLVMLTVFCGATYSQNIKCKSVPTQQPVVLDTLIIEPGSVVIYDKSASFDYNAATQMIEIAAQKDAVRVCYRVMSPDLLKNIEGRPMENYAFTADDAVQRTTAQPPERLLNFGNNIQKTGFISRGVTFGNRQNVFVNSMLNLQMSGEISDNLNIEAVITDQNIPYQPEGNTQQIRDFDNVYIRLFNDQFDLTAGDIVLTNPFEESYFLKYYKNVQGLRLNYQTQLGQWKSKSHAAGSAAKGKFASIAIEPIEGSQGPYRLRGPNGERFIIVLANSEKVFLDGQRLDRGFDKDYVIDYNLGEITFNANVLITQFSIIRVDFEYVEQFYSRTSFAAAQSLEKGPLKIRVNHYAEKDNNASTIGFQPSESDVDFLQSIGDNTALAQISGVDSVAFDPDRILYARVDTVDNDGQATEIFRYSTDPEEANFSVGFTEVGFGNGNYVLEETTTNGRVYRWVSPQSGVPQGNYAPAQQIPLPILRQMSTLAVDYAISHHESITQEMAVSRNDKNLYSSIDDANNTGIAWMGNIQSTGREVMTGYQWKSRVFWEVDQQDFNRIDRYRPILFDRDWDYNPDDQPRRDYFVGLSTAFSRNDNQKISYEVKRREIPGQIDGWQHNAVINQKAGSFYLKSDHFLLDNERGDIESDWARTRNNLSMAGFGVVPGYIFSLDQNQSVRGDSVISSQMFYSSHEFYLTNADSVKTQFRLSYENRKDEAPIQGEMQDFLDADNYKLSLKQQFDQHLVQLNGAYRKTRDQQNESLEEWMNARLLWNGNLIGQHLTHQLTYQIGNVRELKREFIYVQVGGNQGTHTWRDENDDGIKDLNEFYEAVNPDERQYAKFFVPTDEYLTAFETRYQHVINVRFPATWRGKNGWRDLLSRWRAQVSMNVHYKTTSHDAADRLNPFGLDPENTNVLFTANRWNYRLFFNQADDGLGWRATYTQADRKQLLSNGFELGTNENWESVARWRFNQIYTLQFINTWGRQLNSSDFLENRNLNIRSYGLGPGLIWQPTTSFRIRTGFRYQKKRNTLEGNNQNSNLREWKGELTWNQQQKGSLNASVRLLKIDFDGEENTFVAYQLLEALNPGQNFTWQLNWQRNLGKGMEISVQYNGRSSETQRPIHTGTATVIAYF